jgi:hypothetical protein
VAQHLSFWISPVKDSIKSISIAPFAAKAAGHIAPETLDANIMYTPAKYIRYTSTSGDAAEHSLCLRL